ncbi:LysR family transcriptional regulator substrate-binding protein [Kocuria palustris]|uniref:LysR family transcriptional regulator substrate-binding protein n=1 Tax=Kocuria palustris TaxID=71999 RepID=UPI0006AA31D3|nr:LysR family transcriptional regulator substrate-binding protein [Kocuria palustris]MCT1833973.1 LysR family transcriptional regulator substrate-binding protein [Kocuria palustris]
MESHAHPEPEQQDAADQQDVPGPSSGASDTAQGPVLRVGYETGMMPGKWLRRWRERGDGLDEQQLAPGQWPQALGETVDVALIRLAPHPHIEAGAALADLTQLRESFHVVELYDEQQVVILPVDDELTLLDDVPVGELADEWLLQELDQLPEHRPSAEGRGTDDAGAPRQLPEITDSGAAVELVAAGVGLYVAPMSVARWHHRKDLTYRPIQDLPLVPVVLVWPKDLPEQTEAMVQDFQGIVRGRREGSSRGSESEAIASRGDEDLSNNRDPEVQRAASAARKRSKPKSGSASGGSRTGKGTSRGDQLAGKRLAGGRPRRSGGGRPGGKPKGRGGRPGRGR